MRHARRCGSNPGGHLVTPAEVAAVVRGLCGPDAAGITGQAIPAAGGRRMSATASRVRAGTRAPRTTSKQRLRLWLRLLRASRAIEGVLRERLRVTFRMTLPQFDVLAARPRGPGNDDDRAVAAADGVER